MMHGGAAGLLTFVVFAPPVGFPPAQKEPASAAAPFGLSSVFWAGIAQRSEGKERSRY